MIDKGFNKADLSQSISWIIKAVFNNEISNRPCVFLSHKREDKNACREIAEYFKNARIDYYLDELDKELLYATSINDPIKITESIKKGIRESSHMLIVISEKTYKSQWVPFEVGYGHCAILDKNRKDDDEINKIKLSILTLKDISEIILPDYLQVGNIIRGTKSLNEFISRITNKIEKSLINESMILSNSAKNHPLDNILNWKL